MKKLTATLLATSLLGLAAYGQGTVNFSNLGVGLNAPVFFSDGTTKVPVTGFTAELLAGTTSGNLTAVATSGFLATAAGYFSGGTVALPGIAGGTTAFLEVRVWQTTAGSYNNAVTLGGVNTFGNSSVFSLVTGDPNASPPGVPTSFAGKLTSFNLNGVPEPSSLALAGLGAAALLVFRRRK